MHNFGVGLSIVNAILAVGFILTTAPVVQYRIEKQKSIDAELEKIPGLQADIQNLDRKRVELEGAITREIANVTSLLTRGQNERSELEKRQALQSDLLNDSEAKLAHWQASHNETQAEIAAREAEGRSLDQDLQLVRRDLQTHEDQVADLTQRLEQAEQGVEQSIANIEEHYQSVRQVAESGSLPSGVRDVAQGK